LEIAATVPPVNPGLQGRGDGAENQRDPVPVAPTLPVISTGRWPAQ